MALGLVLGACSPTPTVPPTLAGPIASPGSGPTPVAPIVTFSDGEHRVGVDIQPGTYRAIASAVGGDGFCYWERLRGFGGTQADVIANAAGTGPRVVTIAADDAGFLSDDCGTWSTDLAPLASPIADGVWIVGTDLAPGSYTSDGGPSCLWQRLSGFGGTPEDSLAVGTTGEVEILGADRGFSTSGCGTWVAAAT